MERHEFITIKYQVESCIERIAFVQTGFGKPSSYELLCRMHIDKAGGGIRELIKCLEGLGFVKQKWNNVRFGCRYLLKGYGINISVQTLRAGHPDNFYVYIDKEKGS